MKYPLIAMIVGVALIAFGIYSIREDGIVNQDLNRAMTPLLRLSFDEIYTKRGIAVTINMPSDDQWRRIVARPTRLQYVIACFSELGEDGVAKSVPLDMFNIRLTRNGDEARLTNVSDSSYLRIYDDAHGRYVEYNGLGFNANASDVLRLSINVNNATSNARGILLVTPCYDAFTVKSWSVGSEVGPIISVCICIAGIVIILASIIIGVTIAIWQRKKLGGSGVGNAH